MVSAVILVEWEKLRRDSFEGPLRVMVQVNPADIDDLF